MIQSANRDPAAEASLAHRIRSVNPRTWDALLTVGLVAAGVVSQFADASTNNAEFRDTDAFAVMLGLAVTVPVYWRRTRPLPALLVSLTAITIISALDYKTNNLPIVVLFLVYGAGAYASRRSSLVALVALNAAIGLIWLSSPPDLDAAGALFSMVLYSGGWLAGQVVRSRADVADAKVAEAEERAEAQRQLNARSVAEERLRLAQELHDVVAHSMSVIAVQAGMGAHVIDTEPDEAKRALETISKTSRTTLQEMRRLLGVLRDGDGTRVEAPAPGLAELPALVADVRNAGIPVELSTAGDPTAVPHGVELSVYRLVQEGLTNVIKHAGPSSAAVKLTYGPQEIQVEIVDDGRGASASLQGDASGGHGLLGMRERVAMWGGAIETGPRREGGYRVLARLPYGEQS